MEFKDYYKILGVSKTATQQDIQKAYRKLARKYHPDVNKDAAAEVRFKEIGEAYDIIKDPEKRAKYDRYGAAWQAAGAGPRTAPGFDGVRFEFGGSGAQNGETFFDILEHMFGDTAPNRGGFGGFQSGRGRWSSRGEDLEARLSLSLEDAARGGKQTISLTDPRTGANRSYTVAIPAGVMPGKRIRLAGQGASGMGGGASGDLYLVVEILPHPKFELRGNDLCTRLDIVPWQAALGAKVTMQTLDGRVRLRVPPGSSSGRKIRVKGHGFPAEDGAGDLYVEIRIVIPESLTEQERELYKKLATASGGYDEA